jgi:hypothetical protein
MFVLGSAVGNISFQASQILGFVTGAAVVAVVDPYRTLGLDAVTFGISALIVAAGSRPRPMPRREAARPSLRAVSADGIRIVFGNRAADPAAVRLAGRLLHRPGGARGAVRAFPARQHGDGGLLMAAMPFGMVVGAFVLAKMATPSTGMRMMGWLAILSCVPLIRSAADPPLWCVLLLWTLAGAGGAYQLAAAAAFVQALRPATRARAFGLAQSGLHAVQGLGILAGGAAAQAIGAPLAGGLADLIGVTAATMLAVSWTQLHGH